MINQKDQMKWILFWVFLILFILMVLGTLGIVFFGYGSPTESEREIMVKGLIGEVAACVIALFYSIFGLKEESQLESKFQEIEERTNQISSVIESLELNVQTLKDRSDNPVAELNKKAKGNEGSKYESSFDKAMKSFNVDPPFSLEEYELNLSPTDIKNDLRKTKPFDVEHRKESYVGTKIQWKALFSTISQKDNDRFHVTADTSDSSVFLSFYIDESLSHKFKHLDNGTPFWLSGVLEEVETYKIKLKNVHVKFEA